jgi:hypothetical protein
MFGKLLIPAMLGAAIAAGPAFAADEANSPTSKPEVYKESQAKPHAKPADGAVKPGASPDKELHKNVQQDANARVKDRSVKPDAPLKKKELYQESQKDGTKEPAKSN